MTSAKSEPRGLGVSQDTIRRWQDAGLALVPVSINVSTRQFQQADFHKRVAGTLAAHALAPRLIELELTEGLLMEDTETAHRALKRLKESGRKLVLVTGRELADLKRVFPELDVFDKVVAENGALVYTPASEVERTIAPWSSAWGRSTSTMVSSPAKSARRRPASLVARPTILKSNPPMSSLQASADWAGSASTRSTSCPRSCRRWATSTLVVVFPVPGLVLVYAMDSLMPRDGTA